MDKSILFMKDRISEKRKTTEIDLYFMEIVKAVSTKATCDRGRSGCVIVKNNSVISIGVVDTPDGIPTCDKVGHLMKTVTHENGTQTQHCFRTIHAEQNAICNAAKNGISLLDTTLYCKMTPCRTCAMLIINSGIKRVVCEMKYHAGAESETMLKECGVQLVFLSEEVVKYEKQ